MSIEVNLKYKIKFYSYVITFISINNNKIKVRPLSNQLRLVAASSGSAPRREIATKCSQCTNLEIKVVALGIRTFYFSIENQTLSDYVKQKRSVFTHTISKLSMHIKTHLLHLIHPFVLIY